MRRTLLAAVLVLAACTSDQAPGLDQPVGGEPQPTSDTLGTCPPGGPDVTTPPAGCIGPDGVVLRP